MNSFTQKTSVNNNFQLRTTKMGEEFGQDIEEASHPDAVKQVKPIHSLNLHSLKI